MSRLLAAGLLAVLAAALWRPLSHDAQAAVEAWPSPAYPQQRGERIYRTICQGCHMPDGKGATGAGSYPALAGNPRLAAAAYPLVIVLGGRKAMPPFGDELNDEEIAAVVNFIRSNFANRYTDRAKASDVQSLRQALSASSHASE